MHYNGPITSKLPRVKTTIFSVMSALAKKHNAINLSQGFPDFDTPSVLIKEVTKAMQAGFNQYMPMAGLPELREEIAKLVQRKYGRTYNPETEITITAGATQAIFTTLAATIQQDDEVIIIEPAYDCYVPAIEICGGVTIHFALDEKDFSINWKNLNKLISHKTKAIIINSPHNPTGSILKKDDLKKLSQLIQGNDILVLSDEVYEHIIFDKAVHQSIARYPELAAQSIIVSSFGKTFHATGWKIGYILAPENITEEIRKVHQYNVFCVSSPMQAAYAKVLKNTDFIDKLADFYQQKRDLFIKVIEGSRFNLQPAAGTYFQTLDYSSISQKKDMDFAKELTTKHKVAPIPLSPFYANGNNVKKLRFCFAKKDETLKKAGEILSAV